MKKDTKIVIVIIVAVVLLIFIPLFALPGSQFEGSDGAGSEMVEEIADEAGEEYEPWFEPVLETLIGGELPGEMETLFFCIQTGIGVGIIAYSFGYLAARKKYQGKEDGRGQADSVA